MTGIPKAGRPQEPTGTSRGGIACSTATMQDPWQWFPASDSVTGSPAPSTIDVGERPAPIFTPAGRHRRDIRDSVAAGRRVACRSRAQPRDQIAKAGSSNAVATRRLAGSSIASSSWPRRRFWTKACPANTTVALRSCLSPRIGRSRAFGRPWSHSMRLLGYWSVRCQVAGGRSSSTSGYAAARSVVTSRRDPRRADGPLGEPAGSRRVPPLRDEYVDDVPELVDRTVDIAPPAGDLHLKRFASSGDMIGPLLAAWPDETHRLSPQRPRSARPPGLRSRPPASRGAVCRRPHPSPGRPPAGRRPPERQPLARPLAGGRTGGAGQPRPDRARPAP